MSRLEELIQQYCPDGVEYKNLGDVCEITKGIQFNKKDMNDEGTYPVINGGINPSGYIEQFNQDENTITISQGGASAGYVNFITTKFWLGAHCYSLKPNDVVLNRYLYHFVKMYETKLQECQYGAGIPALSKNTVSALQIAVPPLEVQREIVEILDKFTLLSAELSAELKARKEQYEYYKDELLSFDGDTMEWKTLGEICDISRGASPRPIKSFVTNADDGVNWIKIGDVSSDAKYVTRCEEKITQEGAKKSKRVYPGDFILSNSMSFGRPYIMSIEGCIHDGWLSISGFNDFVTSDYLYHVLTSSFIQKEMRKKASFGGAVQNLNADIVRGILIPVPSIGVQMEITEVLDKYSVFCTDIKSGLPAEIEARQKQYEYYRDKLLTFKRLETN